TSIDHQPLQEMSIQEMEDLKQHYLDEMLSLRETIPLRDIISQLPPSIVITNSLPILPTFEDLKDSLIMGNEDLSTIPEKESNEFITSSVEDLDLIPSESKDTSGRKSECDMPFCDDYSSKNEGLDDIEFVGELAPINLIPSGIVEADFDLEEDIRLIEKLLNDDSSPYFLEELNSEIPDAIIESFSPSPIRVEDSDSLMDEIDIFLTPNDSIPPDDDVYFDIEPDTGILTTKVVDDSSDNLTRELYVHVPNVLPTIPTLYPVFDTLLPFSSEMRTKFLILEFSFQKRRILLIFYLIGVLKFFSLLMILKAR
nr:hypothetical protein [Tanacetum cinerariifolium]